MQKYGGSSVADAEKVKNVARRVIETKEKGNDVVVVVSAPGNMTNELIELAHQVTDSPNPREMDMLLTTGEQTSIARLAMALWAEGHSAISFTGPQAGVMTSNIHDRKAKIIGVKAERVKQALSKGKIVVVAGFQGITEDGSVATLARGGSDTSAVALAAELRADICEIYTDVKGVYTADPRIVPEARKIDSISYEEMLEMASLGAKVLHSMAVEYANKFNVPLHVRSSFCKDPGTMVIKEVEDMEEVVVRGVTHDKDQAKISIYGVPDRPGIAYKVFQAIAEAEINVDMIVQGVGKDEKATISFTVTKADLRNALEIVKRVGKEIGSTDIATDEDISMVSVVGIGMKSHAGVAADMFGVLSEKGINIQMISTSEIKISCVIEEKDTERAVCAIHSKFLPSG